MTRTDYIKVSGLGCSRVILAANSQFYKEHGYQIEEPTDEEIKAEFPEYEFDPAPAEAPAETPVDETPEEQEQSPVDERPAETESEGDGDAETTKETTEAPNEKCKCTRRATN